MYRNIEKYVGSILLHMSKPSLSMMALTNTEDHVHIQTLAPVFFSSLI